MCEYQKNLTGGNSGTRWGWDSKRHKHKKNPLKCFYPPHSNTRPNTPRRPASPHGETPTLEDILMDPLPSIWNAPSCCHGEKSNSGNNFEVAPFVWIHMILVATLLAADIVQNL
mmetsp:Transcript_46382/g.54198  ORF Transcript_46382/g.54198 Transcript_46382/m.54198 type:complete len:114 (+) Transcript_46382:44-385(+)